jgi:hypothetical protein
MPHIEAANTSREIDQDIAVDIFDECAVGLGDVHRCRMRETTRDGLFSAAV